jgi:hypothetical protein
LGPKVRHVNDYCCIAARKLFQPSGLGDSVLNLISCIFRVIRALQQQKKHLATRLVREKTVHSYLPKLSVQIFGYALPKGRVSIRRIVKVAGTNWNTLQQHFRALVEKGDLASLGKGWSAWYGYAFQRHQSAEEWYTKLDAKVTPTRVLIRLLFTIPRYPNNLRRNVSSRSQHNASQLQ